MFEAFEIKSTRGEDFREAMALREDFVVHQMGWLDKEEPDRIDRWTQTIHLAVRSTSGEMITYMRIYPARHFRTMMAGQEFSFCYGQAAEEYDTFIAAHGGNVIEVSRLVFHAALSRQERNEALAALLRVAGKLSVQRGWFYWVICVADWFFGSLTTKGVRFVNELTHMAEDAKGNTHVGAVVDVAESMSVMSADQVQDTYLGPPLRAVRSARASS